MKRFLPLVSLAPALLLLGACQSLGNSADPDLAALTASMTGTFSSAAQSEQDEDFFAIQMILKPIWTERTDGYWMYVEQATEAQLEAPYRQRIYHVTRVDGRIASKVFNLPGDAKRFAGAHADLSLLAEVTPASLIPREGCTVWLSPQEEGVYLGGTEGTGCTSDWGEAAYVTSEVRVHPAGITSWDRGFKANGEQAWGAVSGPYVFDRK